MNTKIKILIADDSGLMRLILQDMLQTETHLGIVGTANNGLQALEKTLALKPDVILLDLIMQDYDGLYAVKHIIAQCPTPIILLTSLEHQHEIVFEALSEGAFDILTKPKGAFNSKIREIKQELLQKIETAFKNKQYLLQNKTKFKPNQSPHTFVDNLPYQVICIGASTGGTTAIEHILKKMPSNLPIPILIAQHIPKEFGYSFAQRLNQELPFEVKIAQPNEYIQKGKIYLMPSDTNTIVSKAKAADKYVFKPTEALYKEYNFPSVDSLFLSATEQFQHKTIGILLTGMGKDGALGMQAIYQKQGLTIAQDEKSCVVFGMPKAAIELNAVQHILPLEEISQFVITALS
jgi:two-component system chemotaxis response regulator CheB